jgi:hypothetical protein
MIRRLKDAKPHLRDLKTSYVAWAALALLAVDGSCRLLDNMGIWPFTPYQAAHRSTVWWASVDYQKTEKAPDIALMGSSLMMAAVHGGDATYENKSQKVALHHKSSLLENLLKEKSQGKDYSTFSFALSGEMASDAYVLANTMLAGEKRPKVIIYGVAPRDLMDNALKSPASTEIFRLMSRIKDPTDIAISARNSFWSVTEYGLEKLSFLYGHRPDFLFLQHNATKTLLAQLGYKDIQDEVHTTYEIRRQAFIELPEDSGPNEVVVHPPSASKEIYTDNLPEYRYRYASFKEKQFKEQVSYLEKLLALGEERGIKIILVNMPLTADNVALMPPGLYSRYMDTLNTLCAKHQAQILDLNSPEDFPKQYFEDSVHLNSKGGERFFQVLSERIFKDSQVASTLNSVK